MSSEVLFFEQKSKYFYYLVRLINGTSTLIWGKSKPVPIPQNPQKILIGKCDHLGDLMMITPFLLTLREKFPAAQLTLIHGSWCKALADRFTASKLVDSLIQFSPMVLNRGKESRLQKIRREIREFFSARKQIRREKFDLYFDLRPFSGNTLHLARSAKIPCRIGFGLREFGNTLNYKLAYSGTTTLGQLFNNATALFNIPPAEYQSPRVPPAFFPSPGTSSKPKALLHVISGNPIKNLPESDWQKIISLLETNGISPLLVGAKSDEPVLTRIAAGSSTAEILCGDLTKTLSACAQTQFAITVDSFVAHLVLAAQKPLLILGPSHLKPIVARAIPLPHCHYTPFDESNYIDNIKTFIHTTSSHY